MQNKQTLSTLKPGQSGTILSLDCAHFTKRRLADLGMVPGTEIFVRRISPFGDPIQVHLRGYELTLRKEDAQHIWMEPHA